ncbi:hypothetical protein GCM10010435_54130 [Winogradskya consettensis]|uniref:Uncharacterized protein n=1 Tax=Winogradskya consettensis TaxID=113560 RepID=A0A919SH37_9ACTN|nr:hypothetical protein [Actinoplanes consettensis]GIM71462.1 hypothetical protein Aco04nite_25320 [Actinoplanes consettensis]
MTSTPQPGSAQPGSGPAQPSPGPEQPGSPPAPSGAGARPGRPVSELLRPLRDLAVYALVGAPAVWLFVAIIRLIPSDVGLTFLTRAQNSFYSFVNIELIVMPLAAVLLAHLFQPRHPQARLVTIVALVEYAVAGFFAVVFGFLIAIVSIAGSAIRIAFEEFLVRAAWLAVFALAAYAVFLIWRSFYYAPRPKPVTGPGQYGNPQQAWGLPPQGQSPQGQPPYGPHGQQGFPSGQPGYPPAQPGQPGFPPDPQGYPGQQGHPGQQGPQGHPGQQGQPGYPGQQGQAPYGQAPYGQAPYGQAPYGQPAASPPDTWGQPQQPAWGGPTGQQPVVAQPPTSGPPAQQHSAPPAPPGPFAPHPGQPQSGQPQSGQPQSGQAQSGQAQQGQPQPGAFSEPTEAFRTRAPEQDERTQIVGDEPPRS